ncbi:hypothetical protein [Enterococcus diestrammenae]|uniref:DUF5626 domain-containing protein n=1 Tax=Enterococcus diestrammenae TaxID=1155073 RepID=A0ABV0F8G8_9ENTE|nr:hypothetical protein [Enterococcus diestrammenae]KAF1298271.1 hypothetical protein BAU18_13355 [Enterococcus diestrammenae]
MIKDRVWLIQVVKKVAILSFLAVIFSSFSVTSAFAAEDIPVDKSIVESEIQKALSTPNMVYVEAPEGATQQEIDNLIEQKMEQLDRLDLRSNLRGAKVTLVRYFLSRSGNTTTCQVHIAFSGDMSISGFKYTGNLKVQSMAILNRKTYTTLSARSFSFPAKTTGTWTISPIINVPKGIKEVKIDSPASYVYSMSSASWVSGANLSGPATIN